MLSAISCGLATGSNLSEKLILLILITLLEEEM